MSETEEALREVSDWIRGARRIAVLTGAGISTESGIPDFRGPQGVWTKNPGAEKMATLSHYVADKSVRERAWRHRLESPAWKAEPNAGHRALVTLERAGNLLLLITQNVDGLHERAGAERLVRLHGSVWHVRCSRACVEGRADWLDTTSPQPHLPPLCPHCGAAVRPGVVWFGESLNPGDVAAATGAARCDVFLTIGTSALVYPAAGLVHQAKQHGAFTIEINIDDTGASDVVDLALKGKAEEMLPALDLAHAQAEPAGN